MRQIKFRGLTEGGKWVYGDLVNYVNGQKAIIGRQLSAPGYLSVEGARISPVKPETVGQLLGVKDNSGTELYEGDIAYIAGFGNGFAQFSAYDGVLFKDAKDNTRELWSILNEGDMGNVIGNIHSNPELLEQNDE